MTEKINTINVFPDEKTYTENKTQLTESDLAMVPINLVELPIATTAEATEGTDDTKLMTPKKVKESISVNAPQADWNATTGSSQIINKPTLATVATTGSYNDLSNKPTIPPTPKSYITTNWRSGGNWYRKWSDGFIEQGGYASSTTQEVSITLNVAFSNTNYTVVAASTVGGSQYNYNPNVGDRTTTSFRYNTMIGKASGVLWIAYGY